MDSSIRSDNVSLSSLPEEKSKSNLPTRNALSSVKRSKESVRLGTLSFKPIRFTDLTKEILEAENEPLKEVATTELLKEDECDGQKYDDKVSDELRSIFDGSLDLGVAHLETPRKKTNSESSKEQSKQTVEYLTTPSGKFEAEECKSQEKPVCVNYDELIRTPVNPILRNRIQCQSLRILSTISEDSAPKNLTIDNVFNEDVSFRKPTVSFLKLKNNNVKVEEENKENDNKNSNKVLFSLQAVHWQDNLKEIVVKNVKYMVLTQLGRGGSSIVYHCFDFKLKRERAIKKVSLNNESHANGYINEVKVLERLQKCDKIIKMFDYELVHSEKVLYVILEKGGLDLAKILKELSATNKPLPLHRLMWYWMEMLCAVKQIHENGIIHSDLKPENFLNVQGELKLIDFGIASYMPDEMTSVVRNVVIGSCNYISPEALTNDSSTNYSSPNFGKQKFKVNYKSDVWSLGCILYQMVYRKTPFQHIGYMWAKLTAIMDPNHKIEYPDVDWVPARIINSIKSCLQFNVKSRPSVDELIAECETIFG